MSKEFNHIMVDIETMGKTVDAAIISIAAVRFDILSGEYTDQLYVNVSLKSCLDKGLKVDAETMEWWMSQSDEAKEYLFKNEVSILNALESLQAFISDTDCVWGNSARFDLGILSYAFGVVGLNAPWHWYNERDLRTLAALSPELKKLTKKEGTAHYALDDCIHQIKYCTQIWNAIKIDLPTNI